MPLAGISISYTFDDVSAAQRRITQYFEMGGHRAIYHEGWKAVTRHVAGTAFEDDDWELYHVAKDASECRNLATTQRERLTEMIDLWWREAEEYGVLPLDDRGIQLFGSRFRDHSPHPTSRHYTYLPPLSPVPPQAAAGIGGRSWDLSAQIERSPGGAGVIMASGTENAGISVFIQGERLVVDYNIFGDHHLVTSTREVPTGPCEVGLVFRRGRNDAEVTLTIDGHESGAMHVPFLMRTFATTPMSFGLDHGSPVSKAYRGEYPFEGRLLRVDIQLVSAGDAQEKAVAEREGIARQ